MNKRSSTDDFHYRWYSLHAVRFLIIYKYKGLQMSPGPMQFVAAKPRQIGNEATVCG